KNNGIDNCRKAMSIAQKDLGIPAVLEPEYLASPWLDELSGMTYLSYFMKPGSPGFYATLRWVNSRLEKPIKNFTSDWNDGKVICEVVRSLGGSAPAPENLKSDPYYWEPNLNQALEAGRRLGVQPILSARDMADINVEHLGVMAYSAHYQWIPERPPLHDLINVRLESTSGRVGEPLQFQCVLLDPSLSHNNITIEVKGPENKAYHCRNYKNGRGVFVPQKMGMHDVVIKYDGEEVSSGNYFRALPPMVEVAPPNMAPCSLGSLVQVLVSATGAPKREDILVMAYSPTGRTLKCPLSTVDGTNSATFNPDEVGEWRIEITYQGNQIQGGPFTCSVFDPNGVHVSGLEGALPLIPHAIDVDCRGVGVVGEVFADIVHDKKSIHCRMEKVDNSGYLYRIHFTPKTAGKHRVYIYFNGYDVKGSPFVMRVGTQRRSKSSNNSPNTSRNYSSQEEHIKTYSEKRNLSSPVIDKRTSSPNYIPRVSSPSLSPRAQSPGFARIPSPVYGRESPDYVSSKKLSVNRYNSPSPSFSKQKAEHDTSYVNKMSSLQVRDTHSPVFMEKSHKNMTSSSTSHYSQKESKSYNSYNTSNNIDTSPILKVSQLDDKGAIRKDSWDVLAKTRNILSRQSLESLANMTEDRLDSRIQEHTAEYNAYRSHNLSQNYAHRYNSEDNYLSRRNDGGGGGAHSIRVQPIPDGMLGQPVEFEIDGSGAGSGDLEILVEGGKVTSSVRSLGGQRFKAAFTPHQPLPHRVDIRFNGETVPGSPWHVNVMSTNSSMSVVGDATRLVPANTSAIFEIITSTNVAPDDLSVHVISPSKRVLQARVLPGVRTGVQSVEFVPTEVGTHVIEVAVNGEKLPSGPLIAKVYDAGLIQVADVSGGVVGQPVQFRVDASQAGEGQLEISINEGEVPNHVQVVGGGRCLVSFTPDHAKPHLIDIKFNGETVRGCPFVCAVSDTSRVALSLSHLELVPVNQPSSFHMGVAGGGAAELAVAVRGPIGELPVKVTGDIHSGFTAEFTPTQVGAHQITVDYNGRPVQGTPFTAKAFDSSRVTVGHVARGTVGRPVTFSVDASEAGEGNLEITISARGLNIPTQVHPQGNARFAVSFVPAEACDHVVNVAFNKRPVVGCPLIVGVGGGGSGPTVTLPGPGPIHKPSTLLINHPGRLEDIEVNVEGHRKLLW
ncbi:Actin binding protein, partial [Oryctes borbonicus]